VPETSTSLIAPSKLVGELILLEWKKSLNPIQDKHMPLVSSLAGVALYDLKTSLVSRAAQLEHNRSNRHSVVTEIGKYFETDTLWYKLIFHGLTLLIAMLKILRGL
jgi:chaperone required for assembly of F1-ATPase